MENQETFFKYGNMEIGTRIFFKGDAKDRTCSGTIRCELPNGYYIDMDNGKLFIVHPLAFEEFGGLFQVEEEREAKLSWICKN